MIKYDEKDETLIQVGVSIKMRIDNLEIEIKQAADDYNYSKAAGCYNIVTGLKIALNEISTYFLSDEVPIKNKTAEYIEALEQRMNWIRIQDKERLANNER